MGSNRRNFLKTLGCVGLFSIVPRNVLGGNGYVAPSDQLTKGIIGTGGITSQATSNAALWLCVMLTAIT